MQDLTSMGYKLKSYEESLLCHVERNERLNKINTTQLS